MKNVKFAKGQLVQVRAAGTNKPAADGENLWEVVEIFEGGSCTVRNKYDDARARFDGKRTAAQPCHISMLLPYKGMKPMSI